MLGKVIGCLGGLYSVLCEDEIYKCRARGSLKNKNGILVGDNVNISEEQNGKNIELVISEVVDRKNSLIRPSMANLDAIFITLPTKNPEPNLVGIDKLISIAIFNNIDPIVVISKADLDDNLAKEYCDIYEKAGLKTFVLSSVTGKGIEEIKKYISSRKVGEIYAFAGNSGVGKSTIINNIIPGFELKTGDLSEKISRGKHTTRAVELYSVEIGGKKCYIADTPGFSMLDFENFNFYELEDLPHLFPEFEDRLGMCEYRDCTHLKEEGCAIILAIENGEISKTRHNSYIEIYKEIKATPKWKR